MFQFCKKIRYALFIFFGLLGGLGWIYTQNPGYIYCEQSNPVIPRIAHAGGGYKNWIYTNSLDALNKNKDDYTFFEIDLNTTIDGGIVCIHDWSGSINSTFGVHLNTIPTLAEFEYLLIKNSKFKNCTLDSLARWLVNNPNKRIVTDVKDHNDYVLSQIAKLYPNIQKQFIPQIYDPNEYDRVKSLGFDDIIFTVYLYSEDDSSILKSALRMKLFALTMPIEKVRRGLASRAACLGIPTYAHTVNSIVQFDELRKFGINEVYTDWLGAH